MDTRLTLLTWMVGATLGLQLLMLGTMLAMLAKLDEVSGQLAQIARAIH